MDVRKSRYFLTAHHIYSFLCWVLTHLRDAFIFLLMFLFIILVGQFFNYKYSSKSEAINKTVYYVEPYSLSRSRYATQ